MVVELVTVDFNSLVGHADVTDDLITACDRLMVEGISGPGGGGL